MIINKRKIRSVEKYFGFISEKQQLYICVHNNSENMKKLIGKEIASQYRIGQRIVPKICGPTTRFNREGRFIIHKEKEKEERTFERDYHVVDWHGEDHYGTCYQTRQCFPKERILPPLEDVILDDELIRSDIVTKEDSEQLKNIINIFLEIFGYCEIVDNKTKPINKDIEVKTLQWKILPPGKYPWDKAEKQLNEFFETLPIKNRAVIKDRHKLIIENVPDFLAIGQDSFSGYVVYGFISKSLYIFESNEPYNATYVFKGKWEDASKLSKRDIILGELCYKRLIHIPGWNKNVGEVLNGV